MGEMQQVLEGLSEIKDQNKSIKTKLDELLQWRVKVDERYKGHREKTEELRTIMFEKDGLKDMVLRMWNCRGAVNNRVAIWRDMGMYILKVVVAACILAAIWFFMGLYKSGGK